jgi:hypothetical protein
MAQFDCRYQAGRMNISVSRQGLQWQFDTDAPQAKYPTGLLRADDLVLDVAGNWRQARAFPDLAQYLPPQPPEVDLAGLLLKVAVGAGLTLAAYKLVQAATDEEFGGRVFPASFRYEKLSQHLESHGSWCPGCQQCVPIRALTVDHIVPWAKGGKTSRANAAVLCGPCNSSKGAKVTIFDHIRGRS